MRQGTVRGLAFRVWLLVRTLWWGRLLKEWTAGYRDEIKGPARKWAISYRILGHKATEG